MDLSEGFQQLLANAISFLPHLVTAVVTFILALLLANAAARWVKTRSQDRLKDDNTRQQIIDLFQAGASAGKAAQSLRDFLEESVVDRVASTVGIPDARMRAALISSHLIGLAATRFVVKLEPLASASG